MARIFKDREAKNVYEKKSLENRGKARPRFTWKEEIRNYLGKTEVICGNKYGKLLGIGKNGKRFVEQR